MSILIVTCAFPDKSSALSAARAVVEAGLAACCQASGPVTSVYRWEGKVETAEEFILTCKTTAAAWPALGAFLKARHPYQVPEILAVPVQDGHPLYLKWVECNTVLPAVE